MNANPNDSAFPERKAVGSDGTWHDESKGGLTKREYFAAMIMIGLMADPGEDDVSMSADLAVIGADELIRALSK